MERKKLHNLCTFGKQYLEAGTLAIRQAYTQVSFNCVIFFTLIVMHWFVYGFPRQMAAPPPFPPSPVCSIYSFITPVPSRRAAEVNTKYVFTSPL